MKNHVLAAVAVAGIAVAGFSGLTIAQELTSSSAAAATDSSTTVADFSTADTDKDGKLSYAEALAAYGTLGQQQFDQADVNKDEYLDATEYSALGGAQSVVNEGELDHASSNQPGDNNGGNANGGDTGNGNDSGNGGNSSNGGNDNNDASGNGNSGGGGDNNDNNNNTDANNGASQ